jgi:hypothetical protein
MLNVIPFCKLKDELKKVSLVGGYAKAFTFLKTPDAPYLLS